MKNSIYVLLIAAGSITAQTSGTIPGTIENKTTAARRLPAMDLYFTAPRDLNGLGFGMGVLSPELSLPFVEGRGLELRAGGDFYFTGLDRKVLRDVPLQAPQTGAAKVRLNETLFGLNGVVRISRQWNERVSPYVDGFAGLRALTAGISVTPNDYQPGYESSSSDNLDASYAFQFGAAGGVLIKLGRDVKLNAGVVFSRTMQQRTMDDIRTVSMQGTSLLLKEKIVPSDFIIFKLGITFRIDASDKRSSNCNCCGQTISSHSSSGRSGTVRSGGATNRVGVGRVMK